MHTHFAQEYFKFLNEETPNIIQFYSYTSDRDVSEVTNENTCGHCLKNMEMMKLTNDFVPRCVIKDFMNKDSFIKFTSTSV